MRDDSIPLDLIGSHSLLWLQTNQRTNPNNHTVLCETPSGSRLVTDINCSCSDFQPIINFIQTDYPRVSRNPTRWSRGTKTLGTRLHQQQNEHCLVILLIHLFYLQLVLWRGSVGNCNSWSVIRIIYSILIIYICTIFLVICR